MINPHMRIYLGSLVSKLAPVKGVEPFIFLVNSEADTTNGPELELQSKIGESRF